MKAQETKLLEFLRKAEQLVIPIYQRPYSWTERECGQLWDDIVRAGTDEEVSAHFVGSVVYVENGLYQVVAHAPLLVIDGQQRLTTVTLLLAALADLLDGKKDFTYFSAQQIRDNYLCNHHAAADSRGKLKLAEEDRETLYYYIDKKIKPNVFSRMIKERYEFYQEKLIKCHDLMIVCRGLSKLIVVDVSLDRKQDNPQLIFESLNSTGLGLAQGDLIRNFVLMGLEPDLQSEIYRAFWQPMLSAFVAAGENAEFDSFIRHYLTLKTGEIANVAQVYRAFKSYAMSSSVKKTGVKALVADLHTYSGYYTAMALGLEKDAELRAAFADLRELKVDVVYPLLLRVYTFYAQNEISKKDLLQVVRWIESYVFRRAVCDVRTSAMNKMFASFAKINYEADLLPRLAAKFLLLDTYQRFPTDEEFSRRLQERDLYNFRRASYWLRRLENDGRKEIINLNEYTIEHIMPQTLDPSWKDSLGIEWQRVHTKYLHTLGNLTLTGYNPNYSNHSFKDKRDVENGFKASPIRLNSDLREADAWNEESIKARAGRLAQLAVKIWAVPQLSEQLLQSFAPTPAAKKKSKTYTLADHKHLAETSSMRPLFDQICAYCLGLDPCVTQESMKYYVAFKFGTNFMDVVPQAKKLRLMLNMRFADVRDPMRKCHDLTGRKRWGNGDVAIYVSSKAELPYALDMVSQAFQHVVKDKIVV